MKGLLCYFSGTGNTKWIADHLTDELATHGCHAEMASMEGLATVDPSAYDFLIIGTPVYAELPPPFVDDFVRRLPANHSVKRCMVYSTQGAVTPCAAKHVSKTLIAKGYPVVVEALFRMPNNYYFGAGIQPTAAKIGRYLREAEREVRAVAASFVAGTEQLSPSSILQLGYGRTVSYFFRRLVPRLGTKFRASEDCTGCGLCARRCPSHNIRMENNRAHFDTNCMICTRCIHICPVNAIRYGGKKIEQTQRSIIGVLDQPDAVQ